MKFDLMIFCWLEAILTKLAESVLARKKFQIKACYKILGTEIQVMQSSTVKLRKSQGKPNYTRQNENSLDRLPCNLSYN